MTFVCRCTQRRYSIGPAWRTQGRSLGGVCCRKVVVRSSETIRDTQDDPPELDDRTINELMNLGMTREEAEAEAAWDPTEADPLQEQSYSFDSLYSLNDAVPEDVRKELTRVGYGPPAMIAAGFRLEEYAVMRYLLDGIGASHVKLLIADEQMLHKPLDDALKQEEIDWEAPRPEDGIQGGGWGASRACLFSGLSVAQQGALVEILEGQGIDNIAVCAAVQAAAHEPVGKLLAEAVQEDRRRQKEDKVEKARRQREAAREKHDPASSGSEGSIPGNIPEWAEDVDPSHVVTGRSGKLPDIREELKGRLKTVAEVVGSATTTNDIDLNTGLTKDEAAQRAAFLQDLLPQEKISDYIKDANQAELDAADQRLWARHAEDLEDEEMEAVEAAKKIAEEEVMKGDPTSDAFPPVYETYETKDQEDQPSNRAAKGFGAAKETRKDEADVDPSWRIVADDPQRESLWEGMADVTDAVNDAAQEVLDVKGSGSSGTTSRGSTSKSALRKGGGSSTETPSQSGTVATSDATVTTTPAGDNDIVYSFGSAGNSDSETMFEVTQPRETEGVSEGADAALYSEEGPSKEASDLTEEADEEDVRLRADKDAQLIRDIEIESDTDVSASYVDKLENLAEEEVVEDSPEDSYPTTVISASSARPYFATESEVNEQMRNFRKQTIDVEAESSSLHASRAESAMLTGTSAADRSASGSASAAGFMAKTSALDDVILGGDDVAGSTDEDAWLDGDRMEKGAGPVADGSVRSKRAQRNDRPKPNLPTSLISESSGPASTDIDDDAPPQNERGVGSAETLPWLKPDEGSRMHAAQKPPQKPRRSDGSGGLGVPEKTPEDMSMDAISRALKAGIDKETLKRYIDEMAETVADNAGSWLREQPSRTRRGADSANSVSESDVLANALRSSNKATDSIEYGPPIPPKNPNWSMQQEVAAENAARAQQTQREPSNSVSGANAAVGANNAAGAGVASSTKSSTASMNLPPRIRWDKFNALNPKRGIGIAGMSDEERIRIMDEEIPKSGMGKFDPPSDRGVGGTVESSIGELLDDENVLDNSDIFGEKSEIYDYYNPMGSAFARPGDEDPNNPKGERRKGEGRSDRMTVSDARKLRESEMKGMGIDDDQMRETAAAWRRGSLPGSGMARVRSLYAAQFSEGFQGEEGDGSVGDLEDGALSDEEVPESRPATLDQLKAAAERHGLDLQKLIADAKEKGVDVQGV